jgi:hypothetical protein
MTKPHDNPDDKKDDKSDDNPNDNVTEQNHTTTQMKHQMATPDDNTR